MAADQLTRHRTVIERHSQPRDGLQWRWHCRDCHDHSGAGNRWHVVFSTAERHALGRRMR